MQSDDSDKQELQVLLENKVNDLHASEKSLQKALDAYETGVCSLHDFAERKKINEAKVAQLKEIAVINSQLEGIMRYSEEEIEKLMNEFKENWRKAATSKENNQLLKSLVNRIWYDREGDAITFEIECR